MVTVPWLRKTHPVRPASATDIDSASSAVPYVAYSATRTRPPKSTSW